MSALSNLFVMVTRPHPAGTALCRLITEQGGNAFHFPTIAFAPVDQVQLEKEIAELGAQEWLIFISPQAVYASVPLIRRAWPHFPPQVKFAAVGAGTAKALEEAGYKVSIYPEGEWNSEGLLNMPAFQTILAKKIAIIRGEGGRELLAQTLSARGAEIMHVVAYKRIMPPLDISAAVTLLKQKKINVMVCGSYESVYNLKVMLGTDNWSYIKQIPLIVMSERIKLLAQNLEFQTIWVTPNANNELITAALVQKRNEICQIQQTQ